MDRKEILDKQRACLWPNHILYDTDPLPLDHGEGLYVWDVEGKRYLDFFGSLLTTSVGHNHAHVVEAVRARGLLIGKGGLYGNVIRIALPLTVSAEQVDQALEILDHTLAAVHETLRIN